MDSDTYYFPVMWLVIVALTIGIMAASASISLFQNRVSADPLVQAKGARQLLFLQLLRWILWTLTALLILGGFYAWNMHQTAKKQVVEAARKGLLPRFEKDKLWEAPNPYLAATDPEAELIRYGRDLISHTQDYFGENGLVRPGSINGMNCQNCHLDAGSKPFGNNYFAVQSTYPQQRARSGSLETIPKRVNDCFERSLNGEALDTTSREMSAIVAYLRWLGYGIPKGEKPKGTGLVEVPFLDRAADPLKGQLVYQTKCASCHGANGQGLPIPESARTYPPLWGDKSYNEAAGLFRMSRFAGYVKANMPFGASFQNPQLSDEEAWDVSAFINSQPRPKHPFLQTDWPDISKKPYDHPLGPYTDSFPEMQHKYGPFKPIVAFYKSKK